MKYISENEQGFTTYDKYFTYIDTIKLFLSKELYQFASDPERYDLKSNKTLHDSWLESVTINSAGNCEADRKINIKIELLGQYHDKIHSLIYSDVKAYYLNNMKRQDRNHDDLLFHEIRYENGFIEHEIIFDNGIEMLFICKEMFHSERLKEIT